MQTDVRAGRAQQLPGGVVPAVVSQLPDKHQRELAAFLQRLRVGLGDNLHCVALYGSAVRGGFDAVHSDLNMLIVLCDATVEAQGLVGDAVVAAGVAVDPFLLPLAQFDRAVRAFAVKFASIARAHRVLHGVDVLSALHVRPELTRFLLEQALLNARLRTVQAFLSSRRDPGRYSAYAPQLVPQLLTEMSEVLRLHGEVLPEAWDARVPQLAAYFELDAALLEQLLKLRKAHKRLAKREVQDVHRLLLTVLDAAVLRICADNERAGWFAGDAP